MNAPDIRRDANGEPIIEIPASVFELSDDRGDVVLGVRENDDAQLYELRMSKVGAQMLITALGRHLKQVKCRT